MSHPTIVKFFAEPSPTLDLSDYLIGDNDLQAVLDALQAPQFGMAEVGNRPALTDICLNGSSYKKVQIL